MSKRPQSVAEFPATSCSFCCTASGGLLDGAALEGDALEELGGGAGLLQAVKKHTTVSAKRSRFLIRRNCKSTTDSGSAIFAPLKHKGCAEGPRVVTAFRPT